MNIKQIYLDMDGVLVDLERSLERCENRSIKQVFEQESHGDKNFDPFMWLIKKHQDKKPFLHADPTADFMYFTSWIKYWEENGYNVSILSSASRDKNLYDDIVEQKQQWLVHNNLNHLPCVFSPGGRQKAQWASEGSLLIDDYWENVEYFKNAGGDGFIHKNIIDTERFLVQNNLIKLSQLSGTKGNPSLI